MKKLVYAGAHVKNCRPKRIEIFYVLGPDYVLVCYGSF